MASSLLIRPLILLLFLMAPAPRGEAGPVLVLGDSLSAAHDMPVEAGWVALLAERLAADGCAPEVVNASISGETTIGGLARLPELLARHDPSIVILELGGNDGLRGQPPKAAEGNLARMIELSRASGARVVLVGIRVPTNYGQRYADAFAGIYPALAERYDLPLVPFLLEGIALDRTLMQDDGIHPNARAQPAVLANVLPTLRPLLTSCAPAAGP